MSTELTVVSANLHDYSPTEAETPRRQQQREMLLAMKPDVLCLQEFLVRTPHADDPILVNGFAVLCEQLGMHGRLGFARSHCHVAVLWRSEISIAGWQDYRHWPYHHNVGVATLDVGAEQPLKVASGQFSPFWPEQRDHEAALLGAIAPDRGWMLAGLDVNAVGEDPSYDPEPYANQPPGQRHHLFQCEWTAQWPPTTPAPVNRRATALLTRHGLRDVAPALAAPWTATSGHHPLDGHKVPRRIDVFRATADLLDRVTAFWVTDRDVVRVASEFDHLPIGCTIRL